MESSGTVSSLAVIGFWSGLLGCILLVVDGPLYRAHALGLSTALRIVIPAALFLGVIAVLTSIIGLMRSGSKGMAVAGLVLGVIAAGMPLKSINTARHSPIHDVSTDRDNPPQFVAVLPLRAAAKAPNSTDYDAKTAELQKETYPDIGPLHLDVPSAQAFDRAAAAAKDMKWDVIITDPAQGRIEATATTFWFGFKDDVVVRVTADGSGSRVDVRSLSRIGKSDVGANARRIRDYLAKVKAG
ncbi:MAG: DUF1499 domain-containing protein [Candidatus Angelobacter sp.]